MAQGKRGFKNKKMASEAGKKGGARSGMKRSTADTNIPESETISEI